MALSKGSKKIFEFLQAQRAGVVVTYKAVRDATGWSKVSLNTYLTKRKLAPFFQKLQGEKLKVLMDGTDITETYLDETFTQTAPVNVTVSAGDVLVGELGNYELIEPLGSGAVGHVWSAKPRADSKLVAVKIMLPRRDLLQESILPNIRDRFRREAGNGKRLDHPNLVKYLDYGSIEKNPFLVMELASRSVAKQIQEDGAIPEEEAAKIVECCLSALEYLHSRDSKHRDVKPSNLLEFSDAVKLADLGIVKWSDFDPTFTKGATITRQSVQLGSWFYMAPEQQESPHDATEASDIYSLAVSWIEMLNATLPSPQAIGATGYKLAPVRPGIEDLIKQMHSYTPRGRPSIAEIRAIIHAAYK